MEYRAIVALQAKSDSVRSDPDRLFAERDASVFFFDTTAEWHTRDCDDVPIRGDSRKRLTVSASFPTGPNNDVRYTVPRTAASRGTPPFVEVLPSEDPAGILPRGRHCIRTSGKVTSGTYPYGGFEAPLSWLTLLPSLLANAGTTDKIHAATVFGTDRVPQRPYTVRRRTKYWMKGLRPTK